MEEGRIAGLSAARSLGHWTPEAESALDQARRRRRRAQALADFVNRTFAPPPDRVDTVSDDTIVCRCEEVTGRDIREAVESGARTAGAIKMWTRCGMGPCQGRICGWTLAHYAARHLGVAPRDIGVNVPRVPVKPVDLGSLLGGTNVGAGPKAR